MIERLLAAERALTEGHLDQAERLFGQVVEADARNAMAVVGLAEVALAQGRTADARDLAARALAIDPDDATAVRLAVRAASEPAGAARIPEPGPMATPPGGAPAGGIPGGGTPAGGALPALTMPARVRAWLRRLLGRRG
jgi:tetratricopeptide (TPR) repeat protein